MNTAEIIAHAEKQCKQNGTRLTDKRKQVLSGLLSSNKAMSAYELADYCEKNYGNAIPAMSVYRILDFLEEEHLAHKLKLANKYVACSHITCCQVHQLPQFLICKECQSVKEIVIDKSVIKELDKSVRSAGFSMLSPQLEINCLCNSCSNSPG